MVKVNQINFVISTYYLLYCYSFVEKQPTRTEGEMPDECTLPLKKKRELKKQTIFNESKANSVRFKVMANSCVYVFLNDRCYKKRLFEDYAREYKRKKNAGLLS